MSKPDGGPAFPDVAFQGGTGMSLRDYFAAAAMSAFITNKNFDYTDERHVQYLPGDSYKIADGMLAERDKP